MYILPVWQRLWLSTPGCRTKLTWPGPFPWLSNRANRLSKLSQYSTINFYESFDQLLQSFADVSSTCKKYRDPIVMLQAWYDWSRSRVGSLIGACVLLNEEESWLKHRGVGDDKNIKRERCQCKPHATSYRAHWLDCNGADALATQQVSHYSLNPCIWTNPSL